MTDETPAEQDAGDVDEQGDDVCTGTAHDGPMDGVELTSRRPAGVLLVDAQAAQCWLYDWRDGGFYARSTDPVPFLEDGPDGTDNGWRAAEEGQWDVQAAPWVGGDPDDVDPDGDPDDEPDDDVDQGDQVDAGAGVEVVGPISEGD